MGSIFLLCFQEIDLLHCSTVFSPLQFLVNLNNTQMQSVFASFFGGGSNTQDMKLTILAIFI